MLSFYGHAGTQYSQAVQTDTPRGGVIPILVGPFLVEDDVPENTELCKVVRGMRNGRAGGALSICAEHMKI